jgi:2-methylcitrate dehydratase PrpD
MSAILNTGHATQAGILSALLAERGFTGSHAILEGCKGFCRAYSDDYRVSDIVAELGQRYRILDVWFKRYPTGAYANAPLDALLELVQRHNIGADDVEEVRIKTYAVVEDGLNNPHPSNTTAAMLSLPYCVAVALLDRQVTPQQFTEERMKDRSIRGLMERVRLVVADEELSQFGPVIGLGAIVEVICRDGRRYEGRVRAPKGDLRNPFTEEELLGKFRSLTSRVIDSDHADEIVLRVRDLEHLDSVEELTRLLCAY